MGFILIQYIVLKKGLTSNLLKDRETNKDIFNEESEWDQESIQDGINENKYYYKIKYPNYPIIDLDIEGLSNWSNENNYLSQATEEEKTYIKWNGTKKHLMDKKVRGKSLLQKRLIKWVESKQPKDSNTMLLTKDSPIIPHISLFYKKIGEEPEKTEWTFPNELYSGTIYNYKQIFVPDSITGKLI